LIAWCKDEDDKDEVQHFMAMEKKELIVELSPFERAVIECRRVVEEVRSSKLIVTFYRIFG